MKQAMRKGVALTFSTLLTLTTWASKSNDVRAKIAEKLGDKNELVLKLKKRDKRTDIKLAQVLKYLPKQMRVGGQVVEFNLTENKGKDKNGNNGEDDNTPEGDNDDNNDTLQYDNFPDSASVAINEQKSNPENDSEEDPESGDDGNDGNTGSGEISDNSNSSTQTEEVKEDPDSTEKATMLAFLKDYPANGSDDYNSFINELNKVLKSVPTSVFSKRESNILGRFNSIYFYLTVTKDERAKLKAIAKKLNKIYGWHLTMLDEQSHKELLANPTYKRNYEILKKKFTPDVGIACAKAGKLNKMGRKAYLLTYYNASINAPKMISTVESKKSFLVVYYDDVKYNNMPARDINSHFKSAMNEAKKLMFNNLGVIVIPPEIRTKAVELQKKREAEQEKRLAEQKKAENKLINEVPVSDL